MARYDYRCPACGTQYDRIVPSGTDETACTSCGTPSPRVWTKAPGVIIRPEGYNLRPDDPGYSNIGHLADRRFHTWQSTSANKPR